MARDARRARRFAATLCQIVPKFVASCFTMMKRHPDPELRTRLERLIAVVTGTDVLRLAVDDLHTIISEPVRSVDPL